MNKTTSLIFVLYVYPVVYLQIRKTVGELYMYKRLMACSPGYFGKFCNKSCPLGKFGDRCGGKCFPRCTDEYCDPVNGCLLIIEKPKHTTFPSFTACVPGYFGQFCSEVCPPGRFGDKCGGHCYPKCTEISCHHVVGCQNTNDTTTRRTSQEKSEKNTNYLTVSAGAVISMLLIIIVIQLFKKSQAAKRKSSSEQKRNINKLYDESSSQFQPRVDEEYIKMSSSQQLNHYYRPMDAVYHEIDECASSNAASDIESYTVEFKDVTSLDEKNDILKTQNRKMYLLPVSKGTCSNTDKPDLYLQPVFDKNTKPENKVKTHSYIEVTG